MMLLKLDGRTICQRRMQSLHIVDLLDEVCNMPAQFVDSTVLPCLQFLVFQRLDKALAFAVLPGRAWPAHAQDCATGFQSINITLRSVLDALIGVVDQPRLGLPCDDRL